MKVVVTILCFIAFLLIRSSNNHAVRNESDRPVISAMYHQNDSNHKDRVSSLTSHIDPLRVGNPQSENPVMEEFDSENFKLTEYLLLASDFAILLFFAAVLFIFVLRFAKKIPFCDFVACLHPQRYIFQQNWRI